jgi:hypothetical protein
MQKKACKFVKNLESGIIKSVSCITTTDKSKIKKQKSKEKKRICHEQWGGSKHHTADSKQSVSNLNKSTEDDILKQT